MFVFLGKFIISQTEKYQTAITGYYRLYNIGLYNYTRMFF